MKSGKSAFLVKDFKDKHAHEIICYVGKNHVMAPDMIRPTPRASSLKNLHGPTHTNSASHFESLGSDPG